MTIKINSVRNAGIVKYEITTENLIRAMVSVVEDTANSVFVKFEKERTAQFKTGEKAMEVVNVKTPLSIIRCKEKGYLNLHRISRRVFHRKDEIIQVFENFSRINNPGNKSYG